MRTAALAAGFDNPVLAAQSVFRAVMDAMARPGTIHKLAGLPAAPAPLSPAAAAIGLALTDYETPIWLDDRLAAASQVAQWLAFHTGAPLTRDPARAAFAFIAEVIDAPPFDAFALGTPEYPDRATTLVLQVERLGAGPGLTLTGPGIAGTRRFAAEPLPRDFLARLAQNRTVFPRGVDLVLAAPDAVAALPRTVRVEPAGG